MNQQLLDVDLALVREEYRDALEAHAKAKARHKKQDDKVEDLLDAVLDAHLNESLSDPMLLTQLGTLLVKRQSLQERVDSTKALLKSASERYGIVIQDEEESP